MLEKNGDMLEPSAIECVKSSKISLRLPPQNRHSKKKDNMFPHKQRFLNTAAISVPPYLPLYVVLFEQNVRMLVLSL